MESIITKLKILNDKDHGMEALSNQLNSLSNQCDCKIIYLTYRMLQTFNNWKEHYANHVIPTLRELDYDDVVDDINQYLHSYVQYSWSNKITESNDVSSIMLEFNSVRDIMLVVRDQVNHAITRIEDRERTTTLED